MSKVKERFHLSYSNSPSMVPSVLLFKSTSSIGQTSAAALERCGCDLPGPQPPSSSQPSGLPPDSVNASWPTTSKLSFSKAVQEVLLYSRKPSTRSTYLAQWKRFSIWSIQRGISPTHPIYHILDYLVSETKRVSSEFHQSPSGSYLRFPFPNGYGIYFFQALCLSDFLRVCTDYTHRYIALFHGGAEI